ncbi:MAG: hypothetical protein V9H69_24360 [Anaerolineae bacterium]|jgi:hypothetical protein
MKQAILLLALVSLLTACAAPAAAPTSQPAAGQSLPEVTVYRSPT